MMVPNEEADLLDTELKALDAIDGPCISEYADIGLMASQSRFDGGAVADLELRI